ncbi:class I adenylate-forming enzyme family protein [Parahaliea mediterranea]|uniref:AMP-binding protein n=1 Tax=Parahaliea mediterranea TaxID=651086 RepID=A0A939DK02_9GAMM|nr:AMP-binding protein [Parahaliea mediterranea]MBN7798822.1 AMP-binding protein [Parahaliea mediterranea]
MSTEVSDLVAAMHRASEQLTAPGAPWELEQRRINGVELRSYKNAPGTLRDAIDAGRAHGDKTFVTYQDERYSFDDFFAAADRLAHHLAQGLGIHKGDRVAIAMRNYPEWMMSFVAIASIGAVVVPLNSWGRAEELAYGIQDAGARLVICDSERLAYLADQLPALNCRAIQVRGDERRDDWVEPWSRSQEAAAELPEVDIGPGDLAIIMYTSGTTGKPKGAASTHFAIAQALYNFEYHAALSAMANMPTVEKMLGSGFDPATLLAVPLFHVSGCYAVFLGNLRGGRKLSIMYKWNPEQALDIIARERITVFTGVPAMTLALLESPRFADSDTSSLFALGAGGAACPPHLKDLIYDKLPDAYPGTGYGMTETNATGSSCTGAAFRLRPNAAGTLSPIVEVKTVGENGNALPRGETGEIYIKSPTNVQQYWNLPEASANTFVDGWVATGDVGYVDDLDFLYIVDRIKDMVIRGGENIYPVEVEGVLLGHPAVLEATVFGVPHEQWGEELIASVHLGDDSATEEELRAHVAGHLAGFKVPARILISGDELPKNATGKVLKKAVKEQYLAAG